MDEISQADKIIDAFGHSLGSLLELVNMSTDHLWPDELDKVATGIDYLLTHYQTKWRKGE